jgi:hypothetical protein
LVPGIYAGLGQAEDNLIKGIINVVSKKYHSLIKRSVITLLKHGNTHAN